MYKVLLISALLLLKPVTVFGQKDWKLAADREGVKIYTSIMPGSKIKAVKVECEINASASQLVALIMDVNTSADWLYHTKYAALIKQNSPADIYYYSEVTLPWPMQNRDFVAHLTVSQNPVTKVVVIDGPSVTGLAPSKKGIVRINNASGKWTITPLAANRIKVDYTLHAEPGGNIPAWMVNMFATEGPQQIFKALKVQLQKRAGATAELAVVED